MSDATTLEKLRLEHAQTLREQAEQVINYLDNLNLMGARIRADEKEAAVAVDLIMDLHEVINKMQKNIDELERFLKVSNDRITEPKKKDVE